jgi:hypothetical protein
MLAAIRQAKAVARDRAWLARGELTGVELPCSRAAGKTLEQVVIDLDATLVTAHSDKEGAKGNFKGGFGYHPLGAWLDNTRPWRRCCGPGTPAATPPPTTSRWLTPRWRSCRIGGGTSRS